MTNPVTMSRPIRPFQCVAGRDVAADRGADFEIARYYYDERFHVAEDAELLNALIAATKAEYDLAPRQWAQWYSVVLGFRPDLILELGRSKGNSTALFCQAANRLGRTRVVSVCHSKDWLEETLPRVKAFVPQGWLHPLDARMADILDTDYSAIVKDAARVLVLWDAHGFEIAEIVLGRILPLIRERPHLLLMHDISDNRYATIERSYGDQPIWKGSTWDNGTGPSPNRVNIGWMNSQQDQVIALADFAARNDIEIGSADHQYAQFFDTHLSRVDEMRRTIGDRFFSTKADWAFLSLYGRQPPFTFPGLQRRFSHQCGVALHDIHPRRWFGRSTPLPRTIVTTVVKWEYAAVIGWRPVDEIRRNVPRSLCVRIQVVGGPAGIGVLSADRSVFVESRRILPSLGVQTVFLSVADPANCGPLVVHTWDVPERARVVVEDISVVW
jgi:hypothetical protein